MPNERKRTNQWQRWIERTPAGVAFASSFIGLLSAAAGLWLLLPRIMESLGPKYQISYDFVVATDPGLHCVAQTDATLKIGEKSIGLLQNNCQRKVIAGVARNDVYRIWYLRVTNIGREIPRVSIVQADGSSKFHLPAGDVTLACLGYEGRQGRESKDWTLAKLEFSDVDGGKRETLAVRPAPTDEQLKSAPSDCKAIFMGYPPLSSPQPQGQIP